MSKQIKQMEIDDIKGTFKSVRDLVVLSTDRLSSLGEYTLRAKRFAPRTAATTLKNLRGCGAAVPGAGLARPLRVQAAHHPLSGCPPRCTDLVWSA